MKVLIDSNVILDIGLHRDPCFESASKLFSYPESRLQFFLTPSACTDIYYIVRKEKGHQIAVEFLGDLLETCELCHMNKAVFLEAINSSFKDLDDAVQNFAAIETGLEVIVTRNKKDFTHSQLSIMTPNELIDSLEKTTTSS